MVNPPGRRRSGAAAGVLLFLTVAVGLATATAGAAAPATGSTAGSSIGIGLQPAHPDAATPSYFTLHVAAGESTHDAIQVTNPSTQSVRLLVSAVDGLTGQTSGSVYANRQDRVTGAASWIKAQTSTLVLAAQSSQIVDFTVFVPAGSSAGDHLAGIAFENAVPTTSGTGFPITQVIRNVIGVRVIVAGAASFHPRLLGVSIGTVGSTGIGAFTVRLGDDGLQLAKPVLVLDVNGPSGYHRQVTRQLDTVLPGNVIAYPVPWPDALANGEYHVIATLTGGGTSVKLATQVHLGAAVAGTAPAQAAPVITKSNDSSWWRGPVGPAIVFILGLALAVFLWRRPVRSRSIHRG